MENWVEIIKNSVIGLFVLALLLLLFSLIRTTRRGDFALSKSEQVDLERINERLRNQLQLAVGESRRLAEENRDLSFENLQYHKQFDLEESSPKAQAVKDQSIEESSLKNHAPEYWQDRINDLEMRLDIMKVYESSYDDVSVKLKEAKAKEQALVEMLDTKEREVQKYLEDYKKLETTYNDLNKRYKELILGRPLDDL